MMDRFQDEASAVPDAASDADIVIDALLGFHAAITATGTTGMPELAEFLR